MRGLFVAIEGIDGSGTTTQAEALTEALNHAGFDVWLTGEPTTGEIAGLIRRILRREDPNPGAVALALLFAADRAEHQELLLHHLGQGRIVVCCRYLLSSLAYQSTEIQPLSGWGRVEDWLRSINDRTWRPDLTLLLDCPAEVAAARRAARGRPHELLETDSLDVVRRRYLQLQKRQQGSTSIIDATLPKNEVTRSIVDLVQQELVSRGWGALSAPATEAEQLQMKEEPRG